MNADEIIGLSFIVLIVVTTPIVIWLKSKEENEN